MAHDAKTRLILGIVFGLLAMVVPFLVFLARNDYLDLTSEVLLAGVVPLAVGTLLGIAVAKGGTLIRWVVCAVLLLLYVDLLFHWVDWWGYRALVVTMAAFAIAGLAVRFGLQLLGLILVVCALAALPVRVVPRESPSEMPHSSVNRSRPLLVHLVFDELVGIHGLPQDIDATRELRGRIRDFYLENGFRLYARAFSEYDDTRLSLAHMTNFTYGVFKPELVDLRGDDASLTANEYFHSLAAKGYRLDVQQPEYLQLCVPPLNDGCRTYQSLSTGWLKDTNIARSTRASVLLHAFAQRSFLYRESTFAYRGLPWFLDKPDDGLPNRHWHKLKIGPIPAVAILRRLRTDAGATKPGTLAFALVHIPHSPYIFDEHCEPRPYGEWLHRLNPQSPAMHPNTVESRQKRYARYSSQMLCLHKELEALFSAMRSSGTYKDARILIHGPVGSRIYRSRPRADNLTALTPDDYRDAFSTLLAVKAPGIEPGVDDQPISLPEALRTLVRNDFRIAPKGSDRTVSVFLLSDDPSSRPRTHARGL